MTAVIGLLRALALLVLLGPAAAVLVSIVAAFAEHGGSSFHAAIPNARTLGLLLRSSALAAAVAVSCTVAGTLAATVLARRSRMSAAVRFFFPVLVVVPPYLHAVVWTACILSMNARLAAYGLGSLRLDGWSGAWWAEFMALLPLATGVALVSLESIDSMLVEAAAVQRAAPAILLRILVPLAAPGLAAGAGILFLISFLDYSVPSLFNVNVYALEIFSRYSADGQAVTAALVSIPVLVVAWAVIRSLLSSLRHAASTPSRFGAAGAMFDPWPWWLASMRGLSIALLLGQVVVPVVWLASTCGSVHTLFRAGESAGKEIAVTCQIALACALVAVVLGPVIGRQLVAGGRTAAFWWVAVCVAFAMPGPLVGVGLTRLSTWCPVLREGLSMPVWANASRFLPVAAFIVYAHLRRVDPMLLDASRLYQHSRLHGLLRVRIPLAMPALLLAATICMVLPMGELGATVIVSPPGAPTLMMRLYNLLHYGDSKEVTALCVVLMLLAFIATGMTMGGIRIATRHTRTVAPGNTTS